MTRSSSQDERLSQLQKRGLEVFTEGHSGGRQEAERAVLGRAELILQLSGCWGVVPFHEEMAEGVPWFGFDFCQSLLGCCQPLLSPHRLLGEGQSLTHRVSVPRVLVKNTCLDI